MQKQATTRPIGGAQTARGDLGKTGVSSNFGTGFFLTSMDQLSALVIDQQLQSSKVSVDTQQLGVEQGDGACNGQAGKGFDEPVLVNEDNSLPSIEQLRAELGRPGLFANISPVKVCRCFLCSTSCSLCFLLERNSFETCKGFERDMLCFSYLSILFFLFFFLFLFLCLMRLWLYFVVPVNILVIVATAAAAAGQSFNQTRRIPGGIKISRASRRWWNKSQWTGISTIGPRTSCTKCCWSSRGC